MKSQPHSHLRGSTDARVLVLLGFLVAVGVFLPIFNTISISTRPHSVRVLVTDHSGVPIRNVTVYLRSPGDQHMRDAVKEEGGMQSEVDEWLRDYEHRLTTTDVSGKAEVTGRFVTRWSEFLWIKWGHYEPRGSVLVTHPNFQDREQSLASYMRSREVPIGRDAPVEVVLSAR